MSKIFDIILRRCWIPSCPDSSELFKVFNQIDKDGSNGLDQFEINSAIEAAGVKASSWEVTKFFLEADHNRCLPNNSSALFFFFNMSLQP